MPMVFTCSRCARAANGHATADQARTFMKSRRLIASPQGSRLDIESAQTSTLVGGRHALRGRRTFLAQSGHHRQCTEQQLGNSKGFVFTLSTLKSPST